MKKIKNIYKNKNKKRISTIKRKTNINVRKFEQFRKIQNEKIYLYVFFRAVENTQEEKLEYKT